LQKKMKKGWTCEAPPINEYETEYQINGSWIVGGRRTWKLARSLLDGWLSENRLHTKVLKGVAGMGYGNPAR
jgi:hypothetical protein